MPWKKSTKELRNYTRIQTCVSLHPSTSLIKDLILCSLFGKIDVKTVYRFGERRLGLHFLKCDHVDVI